MPSREATEDTLPTHVGGASDTRDVDVEAFMEERYRQLNVEHILGAGTSQERYELHRQLTKDITALSAALLLWKKSVTASAPISRLPPEVLENIFAHLATLDPPITPLKRRGYDSDGDDDEYHELCEPGDFEDFPTWNSHDCGSLGWMKVSHVCRTWRDVLLPMKFLWAGAVGILPLSTEELVRRAGPCNLTITLRESKRRTLWLPFIWDHVTPSSVSSISASFTEHRQGAACELTSYIGQQETPWSALNSLEVSANGTPDIYRSNLPMVAPALVNAKMVNCTLPFIASSLQRLSIVYDECRPGYNALSLATLLESIGGCQNTLQELELMHCLNVNPAHIPQSSVFVYFAALSYFNLGGRQFNLLRTAKNHIGYPRSCEAILHARPSLPGEEGYQANREPDAAFHSALRVLADELLERHTPYGIILDASYGTLMVSVVETTAIDLGETEFFVKREPEGGSWVFLELPNYRGYSHLCDIINNESKVFKRYGDGTVFSVFEDLRTLRITQQVPKPTSTDDVARFFARTPKVNALQLEGVEGITMKGICDVHANEYRDRSKPGVLVLPELTVLRLSVGTTPLSLRCKILVELLEMRVKGVEGVKGAKRLSRLIVDEDVMISDPENEESAVQRLKGLVDELHWRMS